MMLVDTIENIERAGFRVVIKRAIRFRAIECGFSPLCPDWRGARESELIEWAKTNKEIVVKTANRWLEIGRMDLRLAGARAFRERKELELFIASTPSDDLLIGGWKQRLTKIIFELQEAQEKMRLKTRQAELVFDLFK